MPLANLEKSLVSNLLNAESNETDFLCELLTVGNLTAEKQLEIYKKNINGAFQKILAQIYPACLNILGEEYFNQLCLIFYKQHPSTETDLNEYGEGFFSFLDNQIKIREELQSFEYLAELSLLEWHWHKSYFVADDQIFDFEKLAEISQQQQDSLIFKLSYAFFLQQSAFPLLDIWNANKADASNIQEFILPETNVRFCVYRKDYESLTEELSELQYNMLNDISRKAPLGKLSGKYNDSLQNELSLFIEQGWVTGFYLQP